MITLKDIESFGYEFSETKDCYYGNTIPSKEVPEAIKKKLSEALGWSKDRKASISVDDLDDWRIFFRNDMEHSLIFHYRWGKLHIYKRGAFELQCFVYNGDDYVFFVNMVCNARTEIVPCKDSPFEDPHELKSHIDGFIKQCTADSFEFVYKI